MDLGSVAIIALVAGVVGGAIGAALVGTVEAMLRRRTTYSDRQWKSFVQVKQARHTYAQAEASAAFLGFDLDSRKVITLARQEAIQCGHSHIGTEHLAVALRVHSTPVLGMIWSQLLVDLETMRRRIEAAVPPTLTSAMPTELISTPRLSTIFAMANRIAAKRKREEVPPEFLLMALLDEGDGVGAQVLASLGATAQRVREIVDTAQS